MNKKSKNEKLSSARKRVIIFGIDGAAWEIIEYLISKNKLPNFKKIMDNGVYGYLRSVNPPSTCPGWATMLTGKSPATLNVYNFFRVNSNYELKLSQLKWRKWRPIWDIYSEYGKNIYVFNVPTTIAYEINGSFISGPIWGEDENVIAYPEELNDELIQNNYKIRTEANVKVDGNKIYIKNIKEITEDKFKIMFKFFQKNDWDLLVMAFYYCDQLQHFYWKDNDHAKSNFVIYNYYKTLDDYLGKIINNLPENATLIITSDHGLQRTHTYINLNAWLYKHGFLRIKKNYEIRKENTINSGLQNGLKRILNFISIFYSNIIDFSNVKNKNLFKKVREKLKNSIYVLENNQLQMHKLNNYADWESTQAFSLVFNSIFLNMKGRYSNGFVPKQKYFELRSKIIEELKSFKEPNTDKRVIKNIWTKEEVFSEKVPEDFPDIILEFESGYRNYFTEVGDPREEISDNAKGSAEHLLHGIFLAYGPEILEGKEIDGAKLEDVVPTIFHLNNYPIPSDIDGRVLNEIFKPGSDSAQREIRTAKENVKKSSERDKLRTMKFSKKI